MNIYLLKATVALQKQSEMFTEALVAQSMLDHVLMQQIQIDSVQKQLRALREQRAVNDRKRNIIIDSYEKQLDKMKNNYIFI